MDPTIQHASDIGESPAGDCNTLSDEMREVLSLFSTWRHDGVTPLVAVKGYTELLLKGVGGDLSERQREFLNIIYHSCLRAITLWHHPAEYLQSRFGGQEPAWRKLQLSDVVADTMNYLQMYTQMNKVSIDVPDNLPPIKGISELKEAFICLIEPDTPHYYWKDRSTTIQVSQSEPSMVAVRIQTGLQLTSQQIEDPATFFCPGSRASTADLIVRLHGSHVTFNPLDEGTEFRFGLPVWNGSTEG
ncbi:MAG: HAMP domain-containing histidine kinase [Anaerolineae bacterium]|nr:HAMP domain-containing histidine kinase [Anaerolineae bacterium]